MSLIKNATNLNNSEAPALAAAIVALLTTVLPQYLGSGTVPIVGAAVEAVNAFIAGNPLMGGMGVYGALRLYSKWRKGTSVAVPAAPPTVTGG